MLDLPWNAGETPFMVNDEGTEFWLDKNSTKYCVEKIGKNYVVWYAKTKDGYCTRILVNNEKGYIVHESQQWESILYHIDMMNFLERK